MAKARSRTAARKVKDKWKAKSWYNIVAPPAFDNATIADTLSDNPDKLINRVTGVSLQDLTNDFRKSHIILNFQVNKVEDNTAHTQFVGHNLTSDYLRRMIRRRRSKIEGIYDISTKDGAKIRVKPFATTEKRIQNSQKRVVRESMKKTISDHASKSTMSEFIKIIIDGKMGSDIYKNCKKLYPVKRIEINKTEVISQPTIIMQDKKPKKKEESADKEEKPEKKTEKKSKKKKEEKEDTKEKTEEKDIKETKEIKDTKKEKESDKKEEKKPPAKKKTAKKTTTKKTSTKKKTSAKKKTTTKKTTKKKTSK